MNLGWFVEAGLNQRCKDPQNNIKYALVNDDKYQNFMMFDKNEKHPINFFIYDNEKDENDQADAKILIYSNQMVHITSVNVADIEAFIIYQNDQTIFALQLYNQPNLLIQSSFRSTILV